MKWQDYNRSFMDNIGKGSRCSCSETNGYFLLKMDVVAWEFRRNVKYIDWGSWGRAQRAVYSGYHYFIPHKNTIRMDVHWNHENGNSERLWKHSMSREPRYSTINYCKSNGKWWMLTPEWFLITQMRKWKLLATFVPVCYSRKDRILIWAFPEHASVKSQ